MKVDITDGYALLAVDKIILNGFVQKHYTMADDQLGAVERYKVNEKGEIMHINGNLVKEEVDGRVRIVFKRNWSMNADGDYVHATKDGHIEIHKVARK